VKLVAATSDKCRHGVDPEAHSLDHSCTNGKGVLQRPTKLDSDHILTVMTVRSEATSRICVVSYGTGKIFSQPAPRTASPYVDPHGLVAEELLHSSGVVKFLAGHDDGGRIALHDLCGKTRSREESEGLRTLKSPQHGVAQELASFDVEPLGSATDAHVLGNEVLVAREPLWRKLARESVNEESTATVGSFKVGCSSNVWGQGELRKVLTVDVLLVD